MKLLKDLQSEYQQDKEITTQLESFFNEYSEYEKDEEMQFFLFLNKEYFE